MPLVVDANIICSALVGGRITNLFLAQKLELVAPELIFNEVKKHKEELKQKSKLSEEDFEILLVIIERRVNVVPIEEFIHLFSRAEKLLGEHVKDSPYVALSLHLNCPFWTYEKRFVKIKELTILTTDDVAKLIRPKKKI